MLTHASKLQGKLMLVHGLIDENVHFRHTARLINSLIAARKSYDLLIFPDERHSPRKLQVLFNDMPVSISTSTGAGASAIFYFFPPRQIMHGCHVMYYNRYHYSTVLYCTVFFFSDGTVPICHY